MSYCSKEFILIWKYNWIYAMKNGITAITNNIAVIPLFHKGFQSLCYLY